MAGESQKFELDQLLDYFGRLHFPSFKADVIAFDGPRVVDFSQHLVSLLVVIDGVCDYEYHSSSAELAVVNPVRLTQGDLLVDGTGAGGQAVFNDSIAISNQNPTLETGTRIEACLGDARETMVDTLGHRHNVGAELLYVRLNREEIANHSLNGVFPEVCHLSQDGMNQMMPYSSLLNVVSTTARMRSPGWQTTIRKLGEIVFLNVLASHVYVQLAESQQNMKTMPGYQMVAVLTDDAIGPVVRALMDRPADPWTVPAMAKIADVSKSAFFERFKKLTGAAPLKFLTEIRMQRACRLLSESRFEISMVATQVGYESHSSFSNLFKRWSGMSPAEFRRTHRPSMELVAK